MSTYTVPSNYQRHLDQLMTRTKSGVQATYIWLDGLGGLRSKVKTLPTEPKTLADVPEWVYGTDIYYEPMAFCTEVRLVPVRLYRDPFIANGASRHVIIFCQGLAFTTDGLQKPVEVNSRFPLEVEVDKKKAQEVLMTFKQEYYLFECGDRRRPLGWSSVDGCFPVKTERGGGYKHGVGATLVEGRQLAEAHLRACLAAGVKLTGQNVESTLSTWSFEIGPLSPLSAADDLQMARYLLHRLGEQLGVIISFDSALFPVQLQKSGIVEFSTKQMRTSKESFSVAQEVLSKLKESHQEFEEVMQEMAAKGYPFDVERRLNRLSFDDKVKKEFEVEVKKKINENEGFLILDRRPPSNFDPYVVARQLLMNSGF